jgi:hypothetical protein
MTVKNGGTLFGKTFIPFGKEGDIGDEDFVPYTDNANDN